MAITYKGFFEIYKPEPNPDEPSTLMAGILHSRNHLDVDFYVMARGIPENSLSVVTSKTGDIVEGASVGAPVVFPQRGQRLYIITPAPAGVTSREACGKTLDPLTGTLSSPDAVSEAITYKADIFLRASDNQAELMVAMLGQQTVRIQEIFRASRHINHSDDLFSLLMGGLTSLFGEAEAARILAPS